MTEVSKTPFLTEAKAFLPDEWEKAMSERPDLRKLDIDTNGHTNISYYIDETRTIYFARHPSTTAEVTAGRVPMVSIMPLQREDALKVLQRRVRKAKK